MTRSSQSGAAAHLVDPGDLVIILNYEGIPSERVDDHHPRLVHVDSANRMVDLATGDVAIGTFADRYSEAKREHSAHRHGPVEARDE